MKKLTFVEALKVNETQNVWTYRGEKMDDHYSIGSLKESTLALCDLMKTDFCAEPEKISFECEWIEYFGIKPYFTNEKGSLVLQSCLGKKTKVTVEVIES